MLDLSSQTIDEFMDRVGDLRTASNTTIQQAVDELKNNSNVVAVEYKSQSLRIYTILDDMFFILLDAHYRVKSGVTTYSVNRTKSRVRSPQDVFLNTYTARSISPSGKKKALILSGFQGQFGEDLCPIKKTLEASGFSVDFIVDIDMCDVSATTFDQRIIYDYLDNLHEYDVIYINTHGNTDLLVLGIPYDPKNPSEALQELKKERKNIYLSSGEEQTLGIRTQYIRDHFPQLKNALVHIDACQSATEPEELSDAFLEKGAAVYIGYNESIKWSELPDFTSPFFDKITQTGTSVTQAIEGLQQDWTHTLPSRDSPWDVDVVIVKNEAVKNDPEGFVLIPGVRNSPPIATINEPTDGSQYRKGEQVTFNGSATDEDGYVTSYQWFYGNGEDSGVVSNSNTVYTYEKAASYTVTLKVTDNEGATDEAYINISVSTSDNLKPTAHIDSILGSDGNPTYYAKDTITFNGSGTDPEGQPITKYTWSFGDGAHGEGKTVTHQYATPDTYTVKLSVSDGEKSSDELSQTIRVLDALPDNGTVLPQISNVQVQPTSVKAGNTLQLNWVSTNQEWFIYYLYDMNQRPVNTGAFLSSKCSTAQTQTGVNTAQQGCLWNEHDNQFSKNKSSSWVIPSQLPVGQYMIKVAIWSDADHAVGAFSNPFNVITSTVTNQSPVVISISGPSSVNVNTPFATTHSFADPDGLSDIKWHTFTMSDNTSFKVADPQIGSTLTTQDIWSFETSGRHWIEVYIEDSVGNRSNTQRHYLNVGTSYGSVGQAQCETFIKSGQNKPSTYIVELGRTSGSFTLEYDTYRIKDRILVSYEGRTLYDTGCVGTSGNKTKTISYYGYSTQVTVQVLPDCMNAGNTDWEYTIHCP